MDAGEEWVRCAAGHQHQGPAGTAELFLRRSDQPDADVLLQRRTPSDPYGATWGLPGSARRPQSSDIPAALQAVIDSVSVDQAGVRVEGVWLDDHGGWSATTVIATAQGETEPHLINSDGEAVCWAAAPDLESWNLEPRLAATWSRLSKVGLAPVLIVDGANVVGSRPDGWWRDRAGAAARLRDQLAAAGAVGIEFAALQPAGPSGPVGVLCYPEIILVTEGAARPVSSVPGVEVVPAPGSGDDQIVRLAAGRSRGPRPVVAVTADRELRRRLAEHGTPTTSPGTLLRLVTPVPR